jgi:hypothetical protein
LTTFQLRGFRTGLEVFMKFVTLAAAGLVLLGASPAFAQYGPRGPVARPTMPGQGVVDGARDTLALAGSTAIGTSLTLVQYGPFGPVMRPAMPIAGMPGNEVVGMVREMGLDPIGPPTRSGNFYIQRAADYYGRPMQVIVDARRAQVVSVEAFNAPGSIHGAPYTAANARYAPGPYGRGGHPGYGAPDEDDLGGPMPAPQGARPAPRADLGPVQADPHRGSQPMPVPQHVTPKPVTKSAAITPAKPPAPRKRPATAPQETAGTVEPLRAKPEAAPAPAAAAPAPATEAKPSTPASPAAPAAPAMPPVAPLE